jgi:hypothetical protein
MPKRLCAAPRSRVLHHSMKASQDALTKTLKPCANFRGNLSEQDGTHSCTRDHFWCIIDHTAKGTAIRVGGCTCSIVPITPGTALPVFAPEGGQRWFGHLLRVSNRNTAVSVSNIQRALRSAHVASNHVSKRCDLAVRSPAMTPLLR